MKSVRIALVCGVALMAACSSSSHTRSQEDYVQSTMENSLGARHFQINVDRALPVRGRNVSLSGNYYVRISGDSVYSYLPYYGRAYWLPYGGGEGLIFEGVARGYKQAEGKKGRKTVSFEVRTLEDTYSYSIDVWPNGAAGVYVLPGKKDGINFIGKFDTKETMR